MYTSDRMIGIAAGIALATSGYGCAQFSSGSCMASANCAPGADAESTLPPVDATVDSSSVIITSDDGSIDDGSIEDSSIDAGLDAGDAMTADASDGAPPCNFAQTPDQNVCVINAAYGVFVANSANGGLDTSTCGSMSQPCATIGQAMANADGRTRLFICDGMFTEQVTVGSQISLYGGLNCPDDGGAWTYVGGTATLAAPQNGPALKIDAVPASIDVNDISAVAPNASGQDDAGNGLSSIAVLVANSTVTFRRCSLTAGNGDNGSDGGTGSNYTAGTSAQAGDQDDGGLGGAGGVVTCSDGTSSWGGAGGNATLQSANSGGDGGAIPMPATYPNVALDGLGGAGGLRCSKGDNGASGAAQSSSQADAGLYGTLTIEGWTPRSGSAGQNGFPGQGGGGGGGTTVGPIGGTGGGAGGCGGAGGGAGGGGGASIALASFASSVTLDSCALTTFNGGVGGSGAAGQVGQAGGGTTSPADFQGCAGALGGNGAGGSGGAGGIGGVSACVVYSGAMPIGSPVCVYGSAGLPGAAGTGATGGSNGNGNGQAGFNGVDGGPGLALPILEVQ
jgi:hypothetical protein